MSITPTRRAILAGTAAACAGAAATPVLALPADASVGSQANMLAADAAIIEWWYRNRVWIKWAEEWAAERSSKLREEQDEYEREEFACYHEAGEYMVRIREVIPAGPAGAIAALRVIREHLEEPEDLPALHALGLLERLFPDAVAALDDPNAMAAVEAVMRVENEACNSAAA